MSWDGVVPGKHQAGKIRVIATAGKERSGISGRFHEVRLRVAISQASAAAETARAGGTILPSVIGGPGGASVSHPRYRFASK